MASRRGPPAQGTHSQSSVLTAVPRWEGSQVASTIEVVPNPGARRKSTGDGSHKRAIPEDDSGRHIHHANGSSPASLDAGNAEIEFNGATRSIPSEEPPMLGRREALPRRAKPVAEGSAHKRPRLSKGKETPEERRERLRRTALARWHPDEQATSQGGSARKRSPTPPPEPQPAPVAAPPRPRPVMGILAARFAGGFSTPSRVSPAAHHVSEPRVVGGPQGGRLDFQTPQQAPATISRLPGDLAHRFNQQGPPGQQPAPPTASTSRPRPAPSRLSTGSVPADAEVIEFIDSSDDEMPSEQEAISRIAPERRSSPPPQSAAASNRPQPRPAVSRPAHLRDERPAPSPTAAAAARLAARARAAKAAGKSPKRPAATSSGPVSDPVPYQAQSPKRVAPPQSPQSRTSRREITPRRQTPPRQFLATPEPPTPAPPQSTPPQSPQQPSEEASASPVPVREPSSQQSPSLEASFPAKSPSPIARRLRRRPATPDSEKDSESEADEPLSRRLTRSRRRAQGVEKSESDEAFESESDAEHTPSPPLTRAARRRALEERSEESEDGHSPSPARTRSRRRVVVESESESDAEPGPAPKSVTRSPTTARPAAILRSEPSAESPLPPRASQQEQGPATGPTSTVPSPNPVAPRTIEGFGERSSPEPQLAPPKTRPLGHSLRQLPPSSGVTASGSQPSAPIPQPVAPISQPVASISSKRAAIASRRAAAASQRAAVSLLVDALIASPRKERIEPRNISPEPAPAQTSSSPDIPLRAAKVRRRVSDASADEHPAKRPRGNGPASDPDSVNDGLNGLAPPGGSLEPHDTVGALDATDPPVAEDDSTSTEKRSAVRRGPTRAARPSTGSSRSNTATSPLAQVSSSSKATATSPKKTPAAERNATSRAETEKLSTTETRKTMALPQPPPHAMPMNMPGPHAPPHLWPPPGHPHFQPYPSLPYQRVGEHFFPPTFQINLDGQLVPVLDNNGAPIPIIGPNGFPIAFLGPDGRPIVHEAGIAPYMPGGISGPPLRPGMIPQVPPPMASLPPPIAQPRPKSPAKPAAKPPGRAPVRPAASAGSGTVSPAVGSLNGASPQSGVLTIGGQPISPGQPTFEGISPPPGAAQSAHTAAMAHSQQQRLITDASPMALALSTASSTTGRTRSNGNTTTVPPKVSTDVLGPKRAEAAQPPLWTEPTAALRKLAPVLCPGCPACPVGTVVYQIPSGKPVPAGMTRIGPNTNIVRPRLVFEGRVFAYVPELYRGDSTATSEMSALVQRGGGQFKWLSACRPGDHVDGIAMPLLHEASPVAYPRVLSAYQGPQMRAWGHIPAVTSGWISASAGMGRLLRPVPPFHSVVKAFLHMWKQPVNKRETITEAATKTYVTLLIKEMRAFNFGGANTPQKFCREWRARYPKLEPSVESMIHKFRQTLEAACAPFAALHQHTANMPKPKNHRRPEALTTTPWSPQPPQEAQMNSPAVPSEILVDESPPAHVASLDDLPAVETGRNSVSREALPDDLLMALPGTHHKDPHGHPMMSIPLHIPSNPPMDVDQPPFPESFERGDFVAQRYRPFVAHFARQPSAASDDNPEEVEVNSSIFPLPAASEAEDSDAESDAGSDSSRVSLPVYGSIEDYERAVMMSRRRSLSEAGEASVWGMDDGSDSEIEVDEGLDLHMGDGPVPQRELANPPNALSTSTDAAQLLPPASELQPSRVQQDIGPGSASSAAGVELQVESRNAQVNDQPSGQSVPPASRPDQERAAAANKRSGAIGPSSTAAASAQDASPPDASVQVSETAAVPSAPSSASKPASPQPNPHLEVVVEIPLRRPLSAQPEPSPSKRKQQPERRHSDGDAAAQDDVKPIIPSSPARAGFASEGEEELDEFDREEEDELEASPLPVKKPVRKRPALQSIAPAPKQLQPRPPQIRPRPPADDLVARARLSAMQALARQRTGQPPVRPGQRPPVPAGVATALSAELSRPQRPVQARTQASPQTGTQAPTRALTVVPSSAAVTQRPEFAAALARAVAQDEARAQILAIPGRRPILPRPEGGRPPQSLWREAAPQFFAAARQVVFRPEIPRPVRPPPAGDEPPASSSRPPSPPVAARALLLAAKDQAANVSEDGSATPPNAQTRWQGPVWGGVRPPPGQTVRPPLRPPSGRPGPIVRPGPLVRPTQPPVRPGDARPLSNAPATGVAAVARASTPIRPTPLRPSPSVRPASSVRPAPVRPAQTSLTGQASVRPAIRPFVRPPVRPSGAVRPAQAPVRPANGRQLSNAAASIVAPIASGRSVPNAHPHAAQAGSRPMTPVPPTKESETAVVQPAPQGHPPTSTSTQVRSPSPPPTSQPKAASQPEPAPKRTPPPNAAAQPKSIPHPSPSSASLSPSRAQATPNVTQPPYVSFSPRAISWGRPARPPGGLGSGSFSGAGLFGGTPPKPAPETPSSEPASNSTATQSKDASSAAEATPIPSTTMSTKREHKSPTADSDEYFSASSDH